MHTPTRSLRLVTLLLGLASCTPLPSGTLFVAVTGLPDGVAAAVEVSGPNGFTRTLTGSEELPALPLGSYAVAADDVTVTGDGDYAAVVSGSPAEVTANESALATVTYQRAPALRRVAAPVR